MVMKPLVQKSALHKGRDSYRNDITNGWCAQLDQHFERKFGIKVETSFSLFAGPAGSYVTRREDNEQLTDEMMYFIDGFSSATLWAANL